MGTLAWAREYSPNWHSFLIVECYIMLYSGEPHFQQQQQIFSGREIEHEFL